ncbi:MAG: 2-succinyl-5-enolpyruvyl-6-hydroxy-3-cyclohexene-1-carboxylic-acid synthase [Leptolyngbyaceae bacterium]|nr:2-succinyl-5-enolpyruvyl-6-hydroxy-3-cyclohexene-1-carboxylic-acid synthase [Leptolyngbyaceae bacterium]
MDTSLPERDPPGNYANLNNLWGALIVEELVRNQVTYFVVSPGSRSTPLVVAIARHLQAQSIICLDERAAGFHALGYARATGHPAVLVCSSGTAAANYYPAVIEAAVDGVPLLILSGDRPPELLQNGANQTIQQPNLYGNYVRWQVDLPCPTDQISPAMVLTTVDQAVYRCRNCPPGPVPINCHFREPLAPIPHPIPLDYSQTLQRWQMATTPYSQYGTAIPLPQPSDIRHLADLLNQTGQGLILVGQLANTAAQEKVVALAQHLHWPLLPDVQSGLRFQEGIPTAIPYFDQLWLMEACQSWEIETVVQVGGRLVSKRLQEWLAAHPPRHHIVISEGPERLDPDHTVSLRLQAAIAPLLNALLRQIQSRSVEPWVTQLMTASQQIDSVIDWVLIQTTMAEPAVVRSVSRLLPVDHGLYVANSMPIRDLDRYGSADGAVKAVGCDRGTSGIEGAIAAAAGFAVGRQSPVTLLVGDLSLLHDLNSLALLKTLEQPVIVVVLNNGGGGIFSFLPIAEFEDVFEPYFGTPHCWTFGDAARMFGLGYHQPRTLAEFEQAYQTVLQQSQPAVIEVVSDRTENLTLHQTLQREIMAALETEGLPDLTSHHQGESA